MRALPPHALPRQARRLACAWLPYFRSEIEGATPAGDGPPLLICEGERVIETCAQAAASGVRAGDLLRQARACCPDARCVSARPEHYAAVWEALLEALGRHTPAIEPEAPGLAYLDARGVVPFCASEEAWCEAVRTEARAAGLELRLGVAGNKFTAGIAAQTAPADPGCLLVESDVRAYLAPLPIGWAPLDAETRRRLRVLGIRSLGQFAGLSATAIGEQFGPEALVAHRWAQGKDDRPLLGRARGSLEATFEFEGPVDQQAPLLAAALRLGERLLPALGRQGLAVRRMELILALDCRPIDDAAAPATWARTLSLGEPLGQEKLRAVLEGWLAEVRGEEVAGVIALRLRLSGLGPAAGRQLDLFTHSEGQVRLEETLRRLTQRHAGAAVLRVEPADPRARLAAERYGLTEYVP